MTWSQPIETGDAWRMFDAVPGRDEFEMLLESTLETTYRIAYHVTCDAERAERALQESALDARRAWQTRHTGTGLLPWFLHILTGVLTASENGRFPEPVRPAAARPDCEPRPAADVARALQTLPIDLRLATTLSLVAGLSYRELAAALGTSVEAARDSLHRGRRLLRATLETADQ